jgi:hypothetical protein
LADSPLALPDRRLRGPVKIVAETSNDASRDDSSFQVNAHLQDGNTARQGTLKLLQVRFDSTYWGGCSVRAPHSAEVPERGWMTCLVRLRGRLTFLVEIGCDDQPDKAEREGSEHAPTLLLNSEPPQENAAPNESVAGVRSRLQAELVAVRAVERAKWPAPVQRIATPALNAIKVIRENDGRVAVAS